MFKTGKNIGTNSTRQILCLGKFGLMQLFGSFIILFLLSTLSVAKEPVQVRLDLTLTKPIDQMLDLKIQLNSGQETQWEHHYQKNNQIKFINGKSTLILGQDPKVNPLYIDHFMLPTPNFVVHFENQIISFNIHSVPYTLNAHRALSVSWNQLIDAPNIFDFKEHGEFLGLQVSGNLHIGSPSPLSKSAALYVSDNTRIAGNVIGLKSVSVPTLNTQSLFVNGKMIANPDTSRFLRMLSYQSTENGRLLIVSGNQLVSVTPDQARPILGLSPALTATVNSIRINQHNIGPKLSITNNALSIFDNQISMFTSTPNGYFHIKDPITDITRILATGNQIMINTENSTINPKSLVIFDGDLMSAGVIMARFKDPSLEDYDFNIIRYNDPNFQEKNPTLYRMAGSVGFGAGNPYLVNPLLQKTMARLDLTTNDGFNGEYIASENLDLFMVRDVFSSDDKSRPYLSQPYFTVKNHIHQGYIGVHNQNPKGPFHILNSYATNKTNTILLVTNNRVGVGTNNPQSAIHIRSENPFRVDTNHIGTIVVTANSRVGVNTIHPESQFHVNGSISVGDQSTIVPGSIAFRNNQFIGQLESGYQPVLAQRNQWNIMNNNSTYSSGNIAIGHSLPSANLHIISSQNVLLSVESPVSGSLLALYKNGFLGVHSSNPKETLDINGAIVIGEHLNQPVPGLIEFKNNSFLGSNGSQQVILGIKNQWQPINHNQLIYNQGPVSIGHLQPRAEFDVSGNVIINTQLSNNTFVVSQNGYMGLGTNLPVEPLHSSYAVQLANRTATETGTIWYDNLFKGRTTIDTVEIGAIHPWDNNGSNFTTGSLYLGTKIVPTHADLVVSGNTTIQQQRLANFIVSNNRVGLNTKQLTASLNSKGTVSFYSSSNSPVLTIDQNERLGIGTNQPQSALHLKHHQPLFIENSSSQPLLVVSKNNFIGIRTKQPKGKLHVNGGIRVNHSINNTPGTIRFFNNEFQGYNGDKWLKLDRPTKWIQTGITDLIYDESPIGILTEVPTAHLTISGNVTIQSSVTDRVSRLTPTSIGMGTTIPSANVHVVGDRPLYILMPNFWDPKGPKQVIQMTKDGYLGVASEHPITEMLDVYAGIVVADHKRHQALPGTLFFRDGVFYSQNTAATKRKLHRNMIWKNVTENVTNRIKAPLYYDNGSIAIGNINDPLQIPASFNITAKYPIHVSTPTESNTFMVSQNGMIGIGTNDPKTTLHIQQQNPLLVTSAKHPYILIVSKNYNVGIATKNPIARLSVSGSIVLGNNPAPIPGLIRYDNNLKKYFIFQKKEWVEIAHDLRWKDNDFGIYNATGSIGIQLKAPSANLHVSGNMIVSQLNKSFFVITDNGSLGIGRDNPQSLLHIKGDKPLLIGTNDLPILTVTTNGFVGVKTSTPSQRLSINDGIQISSSNHKLPGIIRFENNKFIGFNQDGVTLNLGHIYQWRTLNNNIYYASGNIGLGTTTPNATLSILNQQPLSITNHQNPDLFKVTSQSIGINVTDPSFGLDIKGNAPFTVKESSNDLTVFTVSSNTSVGILTSNPTEALTVSGAILIGNKSLTTPQPGTIWYTGSKFMGARKQGSISLDDTKKWDITKSAHNKTKGKVQVGTIDHSGQQALYVSGNIGLFNTKGNPVLITTQNNIVIGDTQPHATLTVSGNLKVRTHATTNALVFTKKGNLGVGIANPTATLNILSNSGVQLRHKDNGSLFVVSKNNMIGLASANPTEQLVVNGALVIGNRLTPTQNHKGTIYYDNNRYFGLTNNSVTVNIGRNEQWKDHQETIYYDQGSIGINRQNPGQLLTVSGNMSVSSKIEPNGLFVSANGKIGIGTHLPKANLHVSSNRGLLIQSAGTSPAFVVHKNWVGINVSSPNESLHVSGAITIGNKSNAVAKPGTIWFNNGELFGQINQTTTYNFGSRSPWDPFGNNTTTKNLGIGFEVQPSTNLHVSGNVLFTSEEFKIDNPLLIITNNKIGIRQQFPKHTLSINAPIRLETKDNNYLTVSSNGYLGLSTLQPTAAFHSIHRDGFLAESTPGNYSFVVSKNRLIGVGTLEPVEQLTVSGAIIIGDRITTRPFKEIEPGTIWYDPTFDKLYGKIADRIKPIALSTENAWLTKQDSINWTSGNLVIGKETSDYPFETLHQRHLLNNSFVVSNNGLQLIATNNTLGLFDPNPDTQFTVSGNVRFGNYLSSHNIVITNNKVGIGHEFPVAQFDLLASNNRTALKISRGLTSNALVINQFGNVGIHTPDPKVPLSVSGGMLIGQSTIELPGMIRYNPLIHQLQGYTNQWLTMAERFQWRYDDQSKRIYYPSGNVGIGLTKEAIATLNINSKHPLAVHTTEQPNVFGIHSGGFITMGDRMFDAGPYFNLEINASRNDGHILNIADQFLITSTGSIGIGTATPSVTLDINGALQIAKSKYISDPASRYAQDGTLQFNDSDPTNPHFSILINQKWITLNSTSEWTFEKTPHEYNTTTFNIMIGNVNPNITPNAKLTIKGQGSSSLVSIKKDETTDTLAINSLGQIGIGTDPEKQLHMKVENGIRIGTTTTPNAFVMTKNGNLGLGTLTPNGLLQIKSRSGTNNLLILHDKTTNADINKISPSTVVVGDSRFVTPHVKSSQLFINRRMTGDLNKRIPVLTLNVTPNINNLLKPGGTVMNFFGQDRYKNNYILSQIQADNIHTLDTNHGELAFMTAKAGNKPTEVMRLTPRGLGFGTGTDVKGQFQIGNLMTIQTETPNYMSLLFNAYYDKNNDTFKALQNSPSIGLDLYYNGGLDIIGSDNNNDNNYYYRNGDIIKALTVSTNGSIGINTTNDDHVGVLDIFQPDSATLINFDQRIQFGNISTSALQLEQQRTDIFSIYRLGKGSERLLLFGHNEGWSLTTNGSSSKVFRINDNQDKAPSDTIIGNKIKSTDKSIHNNIPFEVSGLTGTSTVGGHLVSEKNQLSYLLVGENTKNKTASANLQVLGSMLVSMSDGTLPINKYSFVVTSPNGYVGIQIPKTDPTKDLPTLHDQFSIGHKTEHPIFDSDGANKYNFGSIQPVIKDNQFYYDFLFSHENTNQIRFFTKKSNENAKPTLRINPIGVGINKQPGSALSVDDIYFEESLQVSDTDQSTTKALLINQNSTFRAKLEVTKELTVTTQSEATRLEAIGSIGINTAPDTNYGLKVANNAIITEDLIIDGNVVIKSDLVGSSGKNYLKTKNTTNGKGEIQFYDNTTSSYYQLLPEGSIIMWFKGDIPAGWTLCDGNNGTPNLVDEFIKGAVDGNDRGHVEDARANGSSFWTAADNSHKHPGSSIAAVGTNVDYPEHNHDGSLAEWGHRHGPFTDHYQNPNFGSWANGNEESGDTLEHYHPNDNRWVGRTIINEHGQRRTTTGSENQGNHNHTIRDFPSGAHSQTHDHGTWTPGLFFEEILPFDIKRYKLRFIMKTF
ncbi:hypothetical protein DID75_04440 [Candidatus Marinamargulisbacteria bacterium SCGC AG-410-N11]|nr:hypothetical protein DID75_04440 [Candidatus Marinamargulisbacteria bacterium SCGC AG-410-N11]